MDNTQITCRIVHIDWDQSEMHILVDNKTAWLLQHQENILAAPFHKHYPIINSSFSKADHGCHSCVAKIDKMLLTSHTKVLKALELIPRTQVDLEGHLEMKIKSSDRNKIYFSFVFHLLKYSDEFLEQAKAAEIDVPEL